MSATKIQSVAILGAGAMGGMYADHFVEGGVETALVASGERAERLRAVGITVNGTALRASVLDPARDGHSPVDLVLVAVKHYALAAALEDVAPFVGPRTTFVSVLNGLESEQIIAERFGPERVLLCIALGMAAGRDGNDVRYRSPGRLVIGTSPELADVRRVHDLGAVLDRAGLVWEAPEDMEHEMWWKFMVNTCINQASAVTRLPFGAFTKDGPARSLMLALMDEVIAVSGPAGVPLGDADRERWDEVLNGLPPEGRTSMLQDVLADRRTEVALFADHVIDLGDEHGIETPYNQAMSWILS